ncbi:beta-ketoacyl-ACP synthase [Waterburya agarophytonicola K14]|uniref:Beta-ketoacyl-ACP synthase n=1 Tax=Waterburya agarophytonicola KI4 TaxID=2874699 RepID=A0A964BNX4_9CYAN|nr:beta-ketoacyl-ACP synthase [Waterburya agarophytonicola]MCC0175637.1 beta-ketoacyl-ACP synthase [Waterburya agarophytonicola KI4]
MDVVVTGMGLLSCLGSLQPTWSKILQGKSGIRFQTLFSELPVFPLGLIDAKPSKIDRITARLLSDTLVDAQLQAPMSDCGVVIGSSRGCQANWEELVTLKQNNIPHWLDTLPHQSAIATAKLIQTTAPVLAPMAACATGIWALARGYELIRTGRCDRVIAGAVESPITPLTLAAFERMGALAKTGCYPFDRERQGLVLGEGGAMFVLETAKLAASRRAKVYGKIGGFGLTCDAHHISAPQISNGSAAKAIQQALKRSDLEPKDIGYIHAHGTSTVLNDRHEAELIKHIFPQRVAISSTKGATGHTLGASGAIGTAFSLMALHQGYLPPCVGLSNGEFDLDLIAQTREVGINNAMCFSFGFGGQNAVIALSK